MHLTHLAGKRAWGHVLAPGKPFNSFLVPHSTTRAVRHWRPSLHHHYTSSSSPAPTAQHNKGKWIRRGLLTTAVAGVGTLAYILQQDKEYVDNSTHIAHQNIPPLALHPRSGGKKNLCVVSHQLDNTPLEETKPRLVIVGSGWGAVSVLKTLDKDKYNVTVISENNYFLFTPLLPSATVGTLELRSLLEPIRKIAARVGGHFLEGRAMDLDLDNKLVEVQKINSDEDPNSPTATSERFYVPYDKLVVAVGANSISHGVEGLEHTVKLKTIRDAVNIRRKIMNNVEMASLPTVSPEERKKLLSFVVCGGGPTGTEFAAELSDWIEEDFVKWFPKSMREDITITIIQSRDHILNTFDSEISTYAEKRFKRKKIDVVTNARVVRIDEDKVVYKLKPAGDDPSAQPELCEVPFSLCLWSTGIAMTPFTQTIAEQLETQQHQRVLMTDEYLRVKGIPDQSIYALGDCASIQNPKLVGRIMDLFNRADKNQDGALTLSEFEHVVRHVSRRFPLTKQHLGKLVEMFETYDKDHNGLLDMDEMRTLLHDIDSKMTNLPATAQVAAQQGAYLGASLNKLANDEEDAKTAPFDYHHLGTLAYLGNTAVGEFNTGTPGGFKMLGGLWALYLWRSIYWSEQVSLRTRLNLSIDWSKTALFGRDISSV